MADVPQETSRPTFVGDETETFDTRGKAAIPLDYSVGGHGVDVNMEAPISTEDLVRAGGLGARDGIAGAMPTTVDATDYEESLMDARDYEDKVGDAESGISLRPGLGAGHHPVEILGGSMVPSEDSDMMK
ncbi:hypothetical protein M758_3G036000 [Ceratodon purpureus]|uniref:Uncharacterized protein n=1 Tax=Ceratodon purpureus TaxID=3225 RepID=A0A8T0IGV1_CERPU|nr:hypothetical protein KC19_3G036900 [Ceratodon purpureus]KAG0621632.1 hypothetical protein M758_3G036000 [Ceratodon purpureus]